MNNHKFSLKICVYTDRVSTAMHETAQITSKTKVFLKKFQRVAKHGHDLREQANRTLKLS